MKVLGLDLSLTSTGVAAVHTLGAPATAAVKSEAAHRARGDKTPRTLAERHSRLRVIRDEIRHWLIGTTLVVIEAPSYGSAGAGTWERAWLWGSVVDMLFASDMPVAIIPPKSAKSWATGRGDAGKTAMAVHMSRMWPDVDPLISEDEWDALAMASIGAQHLGWLPVELARHREQLGKVAWPELVSA